MIIAVSLQGEFFSLVANDQDGWYSHPLCSAGDDQVIKVWNMDGARLSTIRPTSGFLGQKTSSTRTLGFHPNLMVMAASGNDGYITVSCIPSSIICYTDFFLGGVVVWYSLSTYR